MNLLLAIPALAVLLLTAGCSSPREALETRLKPIRFYGWTATVVNPSPDWNPAKHVLLTRSIGGFSLLDEAGEHAFASDTNRESHNARWLNHNQFVFGPGWNARRAPDGSVTTPSEGITLVTIEDGKPVERSRLCDRGANPRPAGNAVAIQVGNIIEFVDSRGKISEFGEGFDAVPQSDGPGLAWRDTPAFEPDWWTGRTDPGVMHVRWKAGAVDDLPEGMQATWTRDGGVLATVRNAPAPAGKPWWAGGTRIVLLAGPGAPPQTVRPDAYDPASHPLADLMAWIGDDGGVWIGTMRLGGWTERIAETGSRPRWSHDGLRLTWLEPPAAGSQLPAIRVAVLAVK